MPTKYNYNYLTKNCFVSIFSRSNIFRLARSRCPAFTFFVIFVIGCPFLIAAQTQRSIVHNSNDHNNAVVALRLWLSVFVKPFVNKPGPKYIQS